MRCLQVHGQALNFKVLYLTRIFFQIDITYWSYAFQYSAEMWKWHYVLFWFYKSIHDVDCVSLTMTYWATIYETQSIFGNLLLWNKTFYLLLYWRDNYYNLPTSLVTFQSLLLRLLTCYTGILNWRKNSYST